MPDSQGQSFRLVPKCEIRLPIQLGSVFCRLEIWQMGLIQSHISCLDLGWSWQILEQLQLGQRAHGLSYSTMVLGYTMTGLVYRKAASHLMLMDLVRFLLSVDLVLPWVIQLVIGVALVLVALVQVRLGAYGSWACWGRNNASDVWRLWGSDVVCYPSNAEVGKCSLARVRQSGMGLLLCRTVWRTDLWGFDVWPSSLCHRPWSLEP